MSPLEGGWGITKESYKGYTIEIKFYKYCEYRIIGPKGSTPWRREQWYDGGLRAAKKEIDKMIKNGS